MCNGLCISFAFILLQIIIQFDSVVVIKLVCVGVCMCCVHNKIINNKVDSLKNIVHVFDVCVCVCMTKPDPQRGRKQKRKRAKTNHKI